MYRIEGTQHCLYMGGRSLHKRVAKKREVILGEHVHQVQAIMDRYLDDMPNSCLRFAENQVLFFLLILQEDLKWHYRVTELHPKVRMFRD